VDVSGEKLLVQYLITTEGSRATAPTPIAGVHRSLIAEFPVDVPDGTHPGTDSSDGEDIDETRSTQNPWSDSLSDGFSSHEDKALGWNTLTDRGAFNAKTVDAVFADHDL
jgi:hypothetical protein